MVSSIILVIILPKINIFESLFFVQAHLFSDKKEIKSSNKYLSFLVLYQVINIFLASLGLLLNNSIILPYSILLFSLSANSLTSNLAHL